MAEQKTENETRTRVDEFRPLSSYEAFEVVRRNGIEELKRPTGSLAWSGLAAGLAIGFSVSAKAVTFALAMTGFFIPALIGNVIGGTVLFTFIAYAQVSREV